MLILRQKIFLILYPPFENSTTRIAITEGPPPLGLQAAIQPQIDPLKMVSSEALEKQPQSTVPKKPKKSKVIRVREIGSKTN